MSQLLTAVEISNDKRQFSIAIPGSQMVTYKQFSLFLNNFTRGNISSRVTGKTLEIKSKQPMTLEQLQDYFNRVKTIEKSVVYSLIIGTVGTAVTLGYHKSKTKPASPIDLVSLHSLDDIVQFSRTSVAYEKDSTNKEMYKSLIRRGCYVLVYETGRCEFP
eukprot:NODE_1238_length_1661_cov_0.224072.p2 type:complete len:161 gc:universal NODE_1238_length_1661_cov_0.224072:526-44(-)